MNKTHITIFLAVLGLTISVALPAFAAMSTTTPTPGVNAAGKIQCVGAAVAIRESSVDSAISTFTSALNNAYSARANALQQAYGLSTPSRVKAAVKAAWKTFASSVKSARSAMRDAQNLAWIAFRTVSAKCKAPTGVSDTVNAGSEFSGL